MSRSDNEAQKLLDALGLDIIRKMLQWPEASEKETLRLLKQLLRAVRRRGKGNVHLDPIVVTWLQELGEVAAAILARRQRSNILQEKNMEDEK